MIARLSAWLARRTAGGSPHFVLIALGVNLVAAVVTVAFIAFLLTRPIASPADPAPLLILGEEQLQEEAAEVGLDEGQVAPGFDVGDEATSLGLTDLDGRRLELADLSGRPVWIVFWATYCHACREEERDLRRRRGHVVDPSPSGRKGLGGDPLGIGQLMRSPAGVAHHGLVLRLEQSLEDLT